MARKNIRSFMTRLYVAFSIPLAVLLAVMVANALTLAAAIDNSHWLLQRQRVLQLANDYNIAVLKLQAAKRGFTLTSNKAYAQEALESLASIQDVRRKLNLAIARGSEQEKLLHAADAALDAWVASVVKPHFAQRTRYPVPLVDQIVDVREQALRVQAESRGGESAKVAERLRGLAARVDALLREDALDGEQRRRLLAVQHILRPVTSGQVLEAGLHAAIARDASAELLDGTERFLLEDRSLRKSIIRQNEAESVRRFRENLAGLIAIERASLLSRQREVDAVRGMLLLASWVAPFAGLLLLIWVIARTSREIRHSLIEINTAASALASGHLGSRANASGSREFSELSGNFNQMAETIQRRHEDNAALARLGELLQTSATVDEAASIVNEMAPQLFHDATGGAIFLILQPPSDELERVAAWGTPADCCRPRFAREECWALRLGRPHENDQSRPNRCAHLLEYPCVSICLPLMAYGETFGVLFVYYANGLPKASATDKDIASEFHDAATERISLALANIRLRASLHEQAIRDSVTGLYNRRHFDSLLAREIRRAQRHEHTIALVVITLCELEQYKDTFGQQTAEQAQRDFAEFLDGFFRSEDTTFRFDETTFIALLPETEIEDAQVKAAMLRQAVDALDGRHDGTGTPPFTVAVNVLAWPADGDSSERLVASVHNASRGNRDGR